MHILIFRSTVYRYQKNKLNVGNVNQSHGSYRIWQSTSFLSAEATIFIVNVLLRCAKTLQPVHTPKDLAKLSELTNLDFPVIRRFPFLSYLLGWGRVTSLQIWPNTWIGTGTRKAHPSRWMGKESTKPPACFLRGGSMFMFSVVYRFWVRGKTNFQQFFSRWMSTRSWTWSPFCRVLGGVFKGSG